MDATVGFLGLGAMGLPMAKRLAESGVRLVVAPHRDERPVRILEDLGARTVADNRAVLAAADVVAAILPSDRELCEVFLDETNIAAFREGALLLDMTTAAPQTLVTIARRLARAGVATVDAPVSGGVRRAAEGTLSFFCGGSDQDCDRVAPLLQRMGSQVFRLGEVGAGKALKSVNQALAAANTVLTAEALRMVERLGLDPQTAFRAISAGSGASAMFASKFEKMRQGDFRADFTVSLMRKDLEISRQAAGDLRLPVMEAAAAQFAALEDENAAQDIAGVLLRYQ